MKMSNVAKGAAVGLAAGAAVYMATSAKKSKTRMMKKKAGQAIKAVGSVVDDISYLMK